MLDGFHVCTFISSRSSIQSLNHARMYCFGTVYDGEIYVAGGVEDTNTLTSIERFSPVTKTWTNFMQLPRMMCGSGMQVLDSVPKTLICPSRKRKALHVDSLPQIGERVGNDDEVNMTTDDNARDNLLETGLEIRTTGLTLDAFEGDEGFEVYDTSP